tara:strand:+ start:602 stop:775 length:174 start_codon:yes stop_codon:yes gene_type:complete
MNEINVYLTDLVTEGRLTHPEAQSFMDWVYDMELNEENEEKIESTVIKAVEEFLEKP